MAEDIVYDARGHLVRRYLQAKVLPLLKRPTGELVTRVTSDSVLLREAASQSLVGLVNGAVMLVGTLILMAVLDVVLLSTTVVAIVIVFVLFMLLMPALAKMQERAQASLADVGSGLEGTLRAIKTVKAAAIEERQMDRLMADARKARNHGVDAVKREALAWTLAWSGIQLAIIVILAVGGIRIAAGSMEASTLVAFLLYAFGLMGPVMGLSQNVTALQSGMAAAGRINEINALELEPSRPQTVDVNGGGLSLRGVSARYAEEAPWALDDVTITVSPGDRETGEPGCGPDDRAPTLHRHRRGSDHRDGRGPGDRSRHPRRTPGRLTAVRRPRGRPFPGDPERRDLGKH